MTLNTSDKLEELKKFDLDLDFGKEWEIYVDDILSNKKTVEVKTERDIWVKTGNICIELEYSNQPSGINKTESDIWVHNLVANDEVVCSLMFPTKILKKLINNIPKKVVMGGDNNLSKIQLVKLHDIIEYMIK